MGRFNGIYTQINTIIKEKESEYKLVISTDEIVERLVNVDFLATASREDLEDCVLRLAIAVALNDAGYRSVVRGEGLYINPVRWKEPKCGEQLLENAKMDVRNKEQMLQYVEKVVELPEYAQGAFDENAELYDEITKQQLIEMLRANL